MIAKRSRALTHGQRERLDRVDQAFLRDGCGVAKRAVSGPLLCPRGAWPDY